MSINCCRYCVAPKRHPGCHGRCTEYLGEKAKHDEERVELNRKKAIEYGLNHQHGLSVYRAIKIRKQIGGR